MKNINFNCLHLYIMICMLTVINLVVKASILCTRAYMTNKDGLKNNELLILAKHF